MYGVNVKDSGMLGLGVQKYVHAWANPEAESVKSSVVGERRLLARGVYRDICGVRVFNITAEDAPTTCGYVTPPLAYPQVLSTTWKTYRCVIHRILITCGVITRWHKDP